MQPVQIALVSRIPPFLGVFKEVALILQLVVLVVWDFVLGDAPKRVEVAFSCQEIAPLADILSAPGTSNFKWKILLS